jgi:ABC-2 type transport system permease protein
MSDALILSGRALRLSRRNVEAVLTSLMLPVMLMLLFVYLFGGAIEAGTAKYVTYVVPGLLLLCAGYGASVTAISVSHDMAGGIVDRLRSLDVSGAAVLAGHVAASVVRNAASTVVVLGVGLLVGFRPHASLADWVAAAAVLALFVTALSWFAAVIGLVARSPEGASGFTFFVMFLPYPSSAFVPVATMPGWVQGFAAHQPVTPVIETLRSLLLGTPAGAAPWQALAWCSGILGVSVVLSGVLFRRRTG